MKLVTYKPRGANAQLGAIVDGKVINLAEASAGALPNDMLAFLQMGDAGLKAAKKVATKKIAADQGVALADVKLMSPITNPNKVVAIGLNYLDHIKESNAAVPKIPIMFTKYTTSIVGDGDEIRWDPKLSDKVDWEVELAVVIGKPTYRVSEEEALNYVVGYTVCNDVSARDLQTERGDQWIRGKSLDTFCPLGPCIVTKDEIADPHNLKLKTIVNGKVMQDSNTSQLLFKVPYLIHYLSQAFTLLPGDVIITGTPPGVG
ncbi:MAG: fumarylacetoacetate hydrolase family protein, partial [Caldilineaceae bacterium]|nr:fumarylacetoacetate hydrolase family protein [Caldilineaceae bacterium]